jgi:uncharacterized protein with HEPN domain
MEKDKLYVKHILDAINLIEGYVKDINYEKFLENKLIQDGVVRELEIIGEAAKNLSSEFKNSRKEIPWIDITGMRNKLIHEYFGVDLEAVWEVVEDDLLLLKKELLEINID